MGKASALIPASYMGARPVLATPFPTQHSVDSLGKLGEHGPNVWALAIHERDVDEALGSWFVLGLVLAVTVIWGMNPQMEDLPLFLSLCVCISPLSVTLSNK